MAADRMTERAELFGHGADTDAREARATVLAFARQLYQSLR